MLVEKRCRINEYYTVDGIAVLKARDIGDKAMGVAWDLR